MIKWIHRPCKRNNDENENQAERKAGDANAQRGELNIDSTFPFFFFLKVSWSAGVRGEGVGGLVMLFTELADDPGDPRDDIADDFDFRDGTAPSVGAEGEVTRGSKP